MIRWMIGSLLAVVAALALPVAAAEEPAKPSPRAKDERGMRIYYMGFLTRGPSWTAEVTEATRELQKAHLANIGRLAEDGRLLIAGPFAYDESDADQSLRGIFIFDAETRAEAEELASLRPDLDGAQIMAILGIPPGRRVGDAYRHLLELRMDRGPMTEDEATAELLAWAAAHPV